jgi:aquaporin Z
MENRDDQPFPWQMLLYELIGTALLLLVGLSLVILIFGEGSAIERLLPGESLRRSLSGFLFGCVGAMIALSPVGKQSGAHVNPIVTMGFWLMGKLEPRVAIGYFLAQLAGASLGASPLLFWGPMGRSVSFGATLPGKGYAMTTVLIGEVVTTFALITALCLFLAFHRLRSFTPAMIPFLYAIMVPLEASISGTSTNPARSLGPAIISGEWHGWWIYWVGPLVGGLLAIMVCNSLAKRIEVAKLYYFESGPIGTFRRAPRPNVAMM